MRRGLEAPAPAPSAPADTNRASRWSLVALLVVLLLVQMAGTALIASHGRGLDDAYISYRYARNLAEGHGLVFNPGEEPVEGYSNLLYTLLVAAAFRAGADADGAFAFAVATNVIAIGVLLVLVTLHLRRRYGGPAARAGALLLALNPPLWYWAASGLETTWVVLLQAIALMAVDRIVQQEEDRPVRAAAVAAAVLVFLRADGFIVPILLALYLLLRTRRRAACWLGAATVAALVVLLALQFLYYDQALPNSVYVKIDGPLLARMGCALRTLARCHQMWASWLVIGFAAAAAFAAWLRTRRFAMMPVGVFLSLCLFAYYLYIGGDFMGERFLLLSVPIAVLSLFALIPNPLPLLLGLLLLGPLAMPAHLYPSLSTLLFDRRPTTAACSWRALGRYLHRREAGHTIAIDAAGLVPLYSGLRTIDMLGLSDAHIAHLPPGPRFVNGHSKYDPDYIIRRRPDLIAVWTDDEAFNLKYGLARARWEQDYHVQYLVYMGTEPLPRGQPVVLKVAGLPPVSLAPAVADGYKYVVLKRNDTK